MKDIIGYEGFYKIARNGRIWSVRRKKINSQNRVGGFFLKIKLCQGEKYLSIILHKNNTYKRFFIHRLLLIHFKPNPHNYKCCHHKDGNTLNNKLSNLQWCNHSFNIKDGYKRGRVVWNKGKKGVQVGPWKGKKLTFNVWNKGLKLNHYNQQRGVLER